MYVKTGGQLKAIKRIELTSKSTAILLDFETGRKTKFRAIRESTNDEQISGFICTPGSSQNSFMQALFKTPPPFLIKSPDGKFWMTTIFLNINDKIYTVKCLAYNPMTQS